MIAAVSGDCSCFNNQNCSGCKSAGCSWCSGPAGGGFSICSKTCPSGTTKQSFCCDNVNVNTCADCFDAGCATYCPGSNTCRDAGLGPCPNNQGPSLNETACECSLTYLSSGCNGCLNYQGCQYCPGGIVNGAQRSSCVMTPLVGNCPVNLTTTCTSCSTYTSCKTCAADSKCTWCQSPTSSVCTESCSGTGLSNITNCNNTDPCQNYTNCTSCNAATGCTWGSATLPSGFGGTQGCANQSLFAAGTFTTVTCNAASPCHNYTTCSTCVQGSGGPCVWCVVNGGTSGTCNTGCYVGTTIRTSSGCLLTYKNVTTIVQPKAASTTMIWVNLPMLVLMLIILLVH